MKRALPEPSVHIPLALAANESPYPPPPQVIERIGFAARSANRYPDMASAELARVLANRHGLEPARITVGCGSVALCGQLVQAATAPGDEVLYAWRSFEAYPSLTTAHGAVSAQVPLVDHRHDLPRIAERVNRRTKLIFVCNPNNPTGTVVDRAAIEGFLDEVPSQVIVVLDEAYCDYVTEPDVVGGITLLDRYANLVVLRTFSKAYGLAGLRVGYAATGSADLAAVLRATAIPFGVSRIALEAALACLEPEVERVLLERVGMTVRERDRVHNRLREIGYDAPRSQANFVWLDLGPCADEWAAASHSLGVAVRAFRDGVRVTIGTPAENDELLSVATHLSELAVGRG